MSSLQRLSWLKSDLSWSIIHLLDSIKSRISNRGNWTNIRAKYYGFWQGNIAKLVYNFQRLTLYALIALAIASGVEGSNYDDPPSVALAVKLTEAYSTICLSLIQSHSSQISSVSWLTWFNGVLYGLEVEWATMWYGPGTALTNLSFLSVVRLLCSSYFSRLFISLPPLG